MKSEINFASVAEAAAYFYNLGFRTVLQEEKTRIMRKENSEVIINHFGLLNVVAEVHSNLLQKFILNNKV